MKTTITTVRAFLDAHELTLDEADLNALVAKVDADRHLIRSLESWDDVKSLPALRPPWAADDRSPVARGDGDRHAAPAPSAASGPPTDMPPTGLSPTEVVEANLRAIEEHTDTNVFIDVFAEEARRQAKELESASTATIRDMPLWGRTVAVKDLMSIAGYRMTGGSATLRLPVAEEGALVVERLRRAGAVVIGAANLHEWAFGTTNVNPHFGTVANPLLKNRLAGGSSGGSAAAVGFNMATIGLGTDTGGSVRIPASCCGLVGFKPSFNLVPLDGVYPLGYSLDHVGPITRTVREAAQVMEVLTGRHGAYTSNLDSADLKGIRVGVPDGYFVTSAEQSVRGAFDDTLELAKRAGAELVPVSLPHHDVAPAVYLGTSGAEAAAIHYHTVIKYAGKLGRDVLIRLISAMLIPAYARIKAQQIRRRMADELDEALRDVDVVATPTLPIVPPEADEAAVEVGGRSMPTGSAFLQNAAPFNLTGVPAVTLPSGNDPFGMSIGFQIVGARGRDETVLKVASALERESN